MKIKNKILRRTMIILLSILSFLMCLIFFLFVLVIFVSTKYEDRELYIPATNERIYLMGVYTHDGSNIYITTHKSYIYCIFFDSHQIYAMTGEGLFYYINKGTLHIYAYAKFHKDKNNFIKTKIVFHSLTNPEYYDYIEEFKKGKLEMFCYKTLYEHLKSEPLENETDVE